MKIHLLSQAVSVLGQSWPSSVTSAQSCLCLNHMYRGHGLHFRIFMEPPRLRSNLQASIWNSGKKEFWSSPSTANNVSQQLRSGHIWICTPEGSPGHLPSRAELGLTHLSLVSFLPSAKDALGSSALTKQMQLEEAWVYPPCSITGYYTEAQKKKYWWDDTAMRCGGFRTLTGYKPGLGYKS